MSRLQLMGTGLNKPFKERMRKLYEAFMADSEETNPKQGQIDVSQWVQKAWKGLDGNMINNAWKHIGYAENKGSNLN